MKDIKTFKDLKSIVITFVTAILFFSCNSNEGTVVFEDPKVSPQRVAEIPPNDKDTNMTRT